MKRDQKAYQLKTVRQIILARAEGVSTVAQTEAYIEEFQHLVRHFANKPWALILDLRLWQPSPLPVFELLRKHTLWCFEQQLTHVELIQPNDAVLAWQYIKATDVEKPKGIVRKLAENEEQAMKSLEAAGF